MRRAGQKVTAAVRTTFAASPADSTRTNGSSSRAAAELSAGTQQAGSTDILLSPGGTFAHEAAANDQPADPRRQLAIAIRQRIETRLNGRIHDLGVRIVGNTIVLEGRCATYYSKQLAQHAALGVLEDEQLENAIVVAVPR